jgi:DNA-binding GntR family transcriptional regulator
VFDRRGAALVKVFSAGDFEEIFTLRLALEVMAARLACRKMSPADAAALEANIQRTSAAAKLLEVTRLDVQFHDMIMASARHSRLGSAWANLRPQIEFWLARMHGRLEASNHKTRDETAQSHRGLLEALRSKSPSKAEKAMQDHIEGWRIQFPFEEIVAGRKLS